MLKFDTGVGRCEVPVSLGVFCIANAFASLYESNFPQWAHEPEILVRALQLSDNEIWRCHQAAKSDLIARVKEISGVSLDPKVPFVDSPDG